ncbi:2-oxo acid dehydrogenase subunit E2 [Streptomyces montanus]|uniref:Dihydrolipoamide acetyltransferase component of pyruvate dehydrogenase complex n=1 Tax=Streptomyces montanus TaxID=2580423 RepID=A0A5R9G221_9ACTN|nr:2-oxo acid dehydrogenase subunit E2 [Streptomyces montanus]TLS46993.1 2-oxo acid dehydrogenase subunit E2 [Streptomyces montanus]
MAVEVLLPKIGLTMQEGTIDEWLVPAGASVSEGDALLRLATDKVDVDVEAEAGGLFHPVVPAGTTVPAGALIGWLLAEGEQPPGAAGTPMPALPGANSAAEPAAQAVSSAPPSVNGAHALSVNGAAARNGHHGRGAGGRLLSSPNARRVAAEAGVDLDAVRGTGPGGRIVSEDVEDFLAAASVPAVQASATLPGEPATLPGESVTPVSPLVRRLAKERGIDLAGVQGTGAGGRIRRADLDAVIAAPKPAAAPAPAPAPAPASESAVRRPSRAAAGEPQPGDVLPLTGMRGTIARRMHASLQEMAQLTHGYEVRMDAVVALRAQLKREWADSGLPVPSLNDFLVKAAALALRVHPLLNAAVHEDGVHLVEDIHIGFAVAVPNGLLVPVIEDAAALPLTDLARWSRELAESARSGRISPARLEGATFTVTSLGGYGVDFFTPVINPGNVAILGVGRLRDGVEWVDDQPRRTRVLTLSLTFDHRAVDGAPAAEFLRTVASLLGKPLRLLV